MDTTSIPAGDWFMPMPAFAAVAVTVTLLAGSANPTLPFFGRTLPLTMRYVLIVAMQLVGPAFVLTMDAAYGARTAYEAYGQWMTTGYGLVVAIGATLFVLMPSMGVRAIKAVRRDARRRLEVSPYDKRRRQVKLGKPLWAIAERNRRLHEQGRDAEPNPLSGAA